MRWWSSRMQERTYVVRCYVIKSPQLTCGLVAFSLVPLPPRMNWLFNFPEKTLELFPLNFTWLTCVRGNCFGHHVGDLKLKSHCHHLQISPCPRWKLRTTYRIATSLGSHIVPVMFLFSPGVNLEEFCCKLCGFFLSLFLRMIIYLFIHFFLSLFIYWFIDLFIHLFIYLFIFR